MKPSFKLAPVAIVEEHSIVDRGVAKVNTVARMNIPSPTYFKLAPCEIQYGKMRFLITDQPSDMTINNFLEVLMLMFILMRHF